MNDPLDYFRRMRVEPSPWGILRWIDREIELDGEYDRKYARRLIEALVQLCGGDLKISARHANETDFEEDEV